MDELEGDGDVVVSVQAALRAYARHNVETLDPGDPLPTLAEIEQHCDNRTIAIIVGWLEALIRRVRLAEAHDRQPYPTADAYERACAARTAAEQKLEAARIDLAAHRATSSELLDTIARMHAREQRLRADLGRAKAST
jgi:hypothetical protein